MQCIFLRNESREAGPIFFSTSYRKSFGKSRAKTVSHLIIRYNLILILMLLISNRLFLAIRLKL